MTTSFTATAVVPAAPDTVFATLIDVARLPTWNARMTSVVDAPDKLEAGAEWVVELRVMSRTWHSRSTLEELDSAKRRFVYRSRTDDGNPSYAHWEWTVSDDPAGSRVTVVWSLHPATFWRRVLFVKMRALQLGRQEVPASLAALAAAVTEAAPCANDDRTAT